MNCKPTDRLTWIAALLLAFAAGCGGSDETTPAPTEGNSETASPQAAGQLPKPAAPQADPESAAFPRVEFETSAGTFTVKLRRERAPRTVENFLAYVDQGFYNGTIFHELAPGYAVVGGGYAEEDGQIVEKTALVAIRNEAANGLSNKRGTIAMAREEKDADSARCQFFFNLRDNLDLDYAKEEENVPVWQTAGYCAFGEVEGDGLRILDEIAQQPTGSRNGMDRVPLKPITIIRARRL
ncbi:MAG: peptidyl-prolyl cis-trans isomerase [Planctomycetaceae bacterium]|nr:peptidyl-prolyl cis-trans isomerase [Planctomycetaceae bacterium]